MGVSLVAWYAAIVSTIVLVWDLAKWARAEPRLKISARANVAYPDGEVFKSEVSSDGATADHLAPYCHIEIVNMGNRPTTLIFVDAYAPLANGGEVGASGFVVHRGSERLPVKLGPGEMWSARLDMRHLASLKVGGPPRIRARASYRDRPIEAGISRLA